jgi:hypothetical protein
MTKAKRFSLLARITGGVCTLLIIGVLVVFATYGMGIASGVVLAASVTGLVVPCVLAGDSLLEMVGALVDAFASLFG